MINRLNQRIADRDRQKGFTLIELLVVIIIIGILAAIAIPAFLNQRTKGYDAAAKSDLKNASTAMETFYTDGFKYPASEADLTKSGFNSSAGVTYKAFTNSTGATPGYVIFAKHDQSGQVWVVSSYNGGAPAKVTGGSIPTSVAANAYGTHPAISSAIPATAPTTP